MYATNYKTAVHWCNNALILCNNIPEFDPSIWDNCRFDLYDENDNPTEIFQYYITDCNESDVEFLEAHFPGLLFTFSDVLDCYVLCVDHFGTAWSGVYWETDLENAKRERE